MFGMVLGDLSQQREDKDDAKQYKPDDDVAQMQTDQRIEGRAKDIDADRETLMLDEMHPFRCGIVNKICPEKHRDAPPDEKPVAIKPMQHPFGINDREARGEGRARQPGVSEEKE